jgi:hypothetical protein
MVIEVSGKSAVPVVEVVTINTEGKAKRLALAGIGKSCCELVHL